MRLSSRFIRSLLPLLLLFVGTASADTFTIKDIRVEGLQRISAGTVFNYLPIQVGQTVSGAESGEAIRALYKTGFFKDVRLERESDVLVIYVQERPAIAKIDIDGNKSIEDEQLLKGLKDIGLAEGRVFNQSVLDRIERELSRQYFSLGKYGMTLKSTVTPLERNRVAVSIDIHEGETARIKQINIVGNEAFSDGDLLSEMQLNTGGWLSSITNDNQYSREKMAGDLEKLKSFYLDRGYINFRIDSTQVTISPDKKDIYVTVNIREGDVYSINDIKLAGNLVVAPEELFPKIEISRGEVFSRKNVLESAKRITEHLGDSGYAFANVNSIPDINEAEKTVGLTFFVDPGKRVYVRRINMKGNARTRDEVLRREFRQMEASWFSADRVKRSKERLQRLGYFDDVSMETKPVSGSPDQVDVDVSVKEKSSGSIMAGVGYSQSQGIMFQSSVSQANFLGTGKQVTLGFNTSDVNTLYQLSYTNPYYTVDGISRGFNLKYQSTDYDDTSSSHYRMDTITGGVNFGIPVNEFDRIGINFDVENLTFKYGSLASTEVQAFARDGEEFTNYKMLLSWSHDSRDSAMFASSGGKISLYSEMALPGSDLEFYKVGTRGQYFFPLIGKSVLSTRFELGYADSYGDADRFPIYENFFAGGSKSVRGFEDNSLGTSTGSGDTIDSNGNAMGGKLKTVGSVELFMPPPFKLGDQALRMGAFFDIGHVYKDLDSFEAGDLRSSAGVSMLWLSPVGPLGASIAMPINSKSGDQEQVFQFSLGNTF